MRNRCVRNLVLDSLKLKKLLELQGKSYESLEISVTSFSVSERNLSSKDIKLFITIVFCAQKPVSPMSTAKDHDNFLLSLPSLWFVFIFITIFSVISETFKKCLELRCCQKLHCFLYKET